MAPAAEDCNKSTDVLCRASTGNCYWKASNAEGSKCIKLTGCTDFDGTDTTYCKLAYGCKADGSSCKVATCADITTTELECESSRLHCGWDDAAAAGAKCSGTITCGTIGCTAPIVWISGTDFKYCKVDAGKCVDGDLSAFTAETCYKTNNIKVLHWTGTACEKCASAGAGTDGAGYA